MYMAVDRSYLFLVFVYVAVILLSLWLSTTSLLPANEGLYGGKYNYESFTSLGYSHLGNSASDVDSLPLNSQSLPANTECKKVSGFDGLFCVPTGVEKKIDTFSENDSSLTCPPTGLSNSKGPLCLTKEQLGLLSTRGQNVSGRDSQIGAK
jgi:hypothetical protein